MIATVGSATLAGVDGLPVTVEVHVGAGIPFFGIVGLPDASCREARDRVRAALLSSGLKWPQRRVTVNLAPSGLRKVGSGLDLAIAVALLVADGQLEASVVEGLGFLGELGLDGSLRGVPGVLPLVSALGERSAVVPIGCASEARLLDRLRVLPALGLRTLVACLRGEEEWPDAPVGRAGTDEAPPPDLVDVRGQPLGRLAIEVAAAGGHHLLLVGPPGAGKTMLAQRIVGILPPLDHDEALDVTRIHSAAGLTPAEGRLPQRRPFRAPHHSASVVSLIGGGTVAMRPGEISCAHHGVLFMDELGEFPSDVLDTLRQPLEDGRVLVCRARASVEFPARFLLVAAMNRCPCGGEGAPGGCRCPEAALARYRARVSAPLLDRFDLRVAVDRPEIDELLPALDRSTPPSPESSATVAARVAGARVLSGRRGIRTNAAIPTNRLDDLAPLSAEARRVLEVRLRQGRLTARGLHRVRRVARTLADLDGRSGPVEARDVRASLALRADPFGAETSGTAATAPLPDAARPVPAATLDGTVR